MKHIILACNAGMSTSMLVEKMKEAAATRGLDCHIEAMPQGQLLAYLEKEAQNTGCILLGPQIRYLIGETQKLGDKYNIPCGIIEMSDYGMMRGDNVVAQALKLMGE